MSVDSGLPYFRGKEDFWKTYPPYRAMNLRFEEVANPAFIKKRPDLY